MKKRILSGAQPSGQLHIGNYFGMIERMIRFQNESDLFCFVANYHSMTSINDKAELEENTKQAFIDLYSKVDPTVELNEADVDSEQEIHEDGES